VSGDGAGEEREGRQAGCDQGSRDRGAARSREQPGEEPAAADEAVGRVARTRRRGNMNFSRRLLVAAVAAAVISTPLVAEGAVDLGVVHKIREEALQNSQVMEHLFYLTDGSGSRLTNSPGLFAAADGVVKPIGEWGISANQQQGGP